MTATTTPAEVEAFFNSLPVVDLVEVIRYVTADGEVLAEAAAEDDAEEDRPARFNPNETAYCRFTGEAFTVVFCDGCIAVLRINGSPETFARCVGDLTREQIDAQDNDLIGVSA